MAKTFKHSGDLGDIIFSIPTIQALGGGVLYLDPDGGESSPIVKWADKTRTKLNLKSIEQIKPLLELQDGIEKVELWDGRKVDHDLDIFRTNVRFNNLVISHLDAFQLPHDKHLVKWLKFPTKRDLPKKIVISRTVRVHGNYSYWENNLPRFAKESIFVGLPKEHEIFEYTFGHKVEYYPTPTIMDLAETINSCDIFISNQGFPHAIAEGLHKDLILECYRVYPSVVFNRQGVINV